MNCVFLRGNVGCDPRIKNFDNGGKIAEFTLATTERGFKTKDGREVEARTTWHNIVVKRTGLAGVVEQFVRKGSPLLVSGRLEYRDYTDQQGSEHRIYEVIVEDLELCGGLDGKKGAPAPEPDDDLPEAFSL